MTLIHRPTANPTGPLTADPAANLTANAVAGRARIGFKHDADRGTVIKTIAHSDPMRVIVPRVANTDLPLGVFVTTSGGLVAGDRVSLDAVWDADTAAQVMPQAAEKIYRSDKAVTRVAMSMSGGPAAWVEYLPQETILFDRSRLSRRLRLTLHPTAQCLVGDLVVPGRHAMGETYRSGLFSDDWEVRLGQRLIWADRMAWEGKIRRLHAHAAGLNRAQGFGTILYRGPGTLDEIRDITGRIPETVQVGVTRFRELSLIRLLAGDAFELRRGFGEIWCRMRSQLRGLSPTLPRLWHI